MNKQEVIKILEKHKKHLKELISEGEEYYHYVPVVEAINCILETNTYFEACTPERFTLANVSTDELVKEILKRKGIVTLTKNKELEEIKIDNVSDKIHFLEIMIHLYDDLEKDANDTREAKGFKVYKCKLCEIANDYKNIEEFLNDNSVG